MDRVVEAFDRLVANGTTDEEVVVQQAVLGITSRRVTHVGVVPAERLERWITDARIVVCHGGPGSIMGALAAGKSPLVVPRDPRLREHVDDHQIRFVRWLAERAPIRPIWDLDELEGRLREPGTTNGASVAGGSRSRVAAYLSALVDGS